MHTRSGAEIRNDGDAVVKVHRAGTDPYALRRRLRIAARLGSAPAGCLVAPLSLEPESVDGSEPRWLTRWPRVDVLVADPTSAPWAEAGRLLARLHRSTLVAADLTVEQGGPCRLRRAVDVMREAAVEPATAVTVIERAAAGLPLQAWSPRSAGRPIALVHGDWHLGQLGRIPGELAWRLLDIDDLGVGDPVWDLGRPAGWWAAGVLPDTDWYAFVHGYRAARGPALPPTPEDPWEALDVVARAAVIQAAAAGVVRPPDAGGATPADDEMQQALLAACARMPG